LEVGMVAQCLMVVLCYMVFTCNSTTIGQFLVFIRALKTNNLVLEGLYLRLTNEISEKKRFFLFATRDPVTSEIMSYLLLLNGLIFILLQTSSISVVLELANFLQTQNLQFPRF
jgi:hypothetical protein